jgi:riboflavin synthase
VFTGLVQGVGRIVSVRPAQAGVRIEIDAQVLAPRVIHVGDSIAVNGVCLTATQVEGRRFAADVSRETLSGTCGLDAPGGVNLECSLAMGEAIGGHLVAGHVDGVGEVVGWAQVGESIELTVRAPASLARYLAPKGSLAVNGVSLTVNRVRDLRGAAPGCDASINLIPHTLAATTLGALNEGSRVNLEADLIARYVQRMLEAKD